MNMTNSDCQTARRRLGSESNSDRGQKAHGRNPSAEENLVSRTICDQEGRGRRTAPSRARARKAAKKVQDLDEIADHLAGGPHVQRLDTIDSSLKELIYQLLDTGIF